MSTSEWEQRFCHYLSTCPEGDKSHDIAHAQRVWRTARQIMREVPADPLVVLTASYFHDIVSLPKDHPERHRSSTLSAHKTRQILVQHFPDYPLAKHDDVAHAIVAHSYSANVEPQTPEARIVQDADRLEALGAIGLARVFHVAGQRGGELVDTQDPLADHRQLNDGQYALDHFQTKLLRLSQTMKTPAGREMARINTDYLIAFMAKFCAELRGEYTRPDPDVLRRFTPE